VPINIEGDHVQSNLALNRCHRGSTVLYSSSVVREASSVNLHDGSVPVNGGDAVPNAHRFMTASCI
jgi:hypothetical protein